MTDIGRGETSANGFRNSSSYRQQLYDLEDTKKSRPSVSHSLSKIVFVNRDIGRRNTKQKNFDKSYQPASWETALKNKMKISNRYYKGEEVEFGVELDYFKKYGPGIYLFFHFLKNLSILFVLATIISLIPIIYNSVQGNNLSNNTASIQTYFAFTTIANFNPQNSVSSSTNKMLNSIPDMVITAMIIIFYFFWLHKSGKLTEQVRLQVNMRSYTVVELQDCGLATEKDVQQFLGQFGKITEVAAVRNYNEMINLSKKIYKLEIEKKELLVQKNQQNADVAKDIQQVQAKIEELYKELVLSEDDIKQDVIKFYVSFQSIEQKQKAVAELGKYQKSAFDCCPCADKTPQNMKLLGQKVTIKACHTEPGEIIWENQHITWKTRWMRSVVQNIFLLIIIAVGFLFISFLNILAPSTSTNSVSTSSYTSTTILSVTDTSIVQSWCLSNKETILTTSDSTIYNFCISYIEQYYLKVAMTIGISISIIIIKAILKVFVVFLAKFQRYKSHTEQSKDIIQNLFITYVCTTVLITFLLQAQISGISFKQLISYFIDNSYLLSNLSNLSSYSDTLSNWYIEIGYQICLTWFIMAVHPAITMPPIKFILEKITYCRAQDKKIQSIMQKAIEPEQFQIQDHYANILVVIFVTLALYGGMPIIIPACFFCLFSRYLYFKYIFLRYSKIPKTFDEALDLKVTEMIPYFILVHFGFSVWMFGVTSIFNSDASVITTYVQNLNIAFLTQIGFILDRLLGTWYYTLFFLLVLVIFIFKVLFYNIFVKSFMKDPKSMTTIPVKILPNDQGDTIEYGLGILSTKSICDSYKIQNNPEYFEILSIMERKKKYVITLKKEK